MGSSPNAVQRGKSSFGSVGAKFVASLKQLMTELDAMGPHFVRCVKPNASLAAGVLEAPLVLAQLRLGGMIDAVQLLQRG